MSLTHAKIDNENAKKNNNMISFINKSSRDEFNRIVEFTLSLITKSNSEAEKNETIDESSKAYEYIDACLEIDSNDESTRETIISKYVERNPYYRELYTKYGVEYLKARQANDGDILHYSESVLDNKELSIYMQIYYSTHLYVNRVFKSKAFERNPLYENFVRFIIAFITIERFVSYRLENASDIDYYNDYTLKNMLIEFKLDEFAQLSTSYQKRILQNVNNLIKNKGTDIVIVDILKLFGFDNIQVFKYYLTRDFPSIAPGDNEDFGPKGKKDWLHPFLKFIKVPIGDLNYEKTYNDYDSIGFTEMTINDPYWAATEEECLTKGFNFVQTKYLSVETTMSFMKETLRMSYVINLIMHIQEKYPNENNLYITNKRISSKPIRLVDVLIALNALVIRRNGFVDRTCTDINSIRTVYDYNLNKMVDLDSSKKKVYAFNYEIFDEPQEITLTINPSEISAYYGDLYDWQYEGLRQKIYFSINDLNEYMLVYMDSRHCFVPSHLNDFKKVITRFPTALEIDAGHVNDPNEKETSGKIDISEFTTLFDKSDKMRESLRKDIFSVKNYEGYRQLRHMYDIKYTANIVKSIFEGYATYCDYLKDHSPDLYHYVQDIIDVMSLEEGLVEKDFYREGILNLADIIDAYLGEYFDNLFLKNNSIVGDYIKEYVYKLLNIFKAYTVDINQISIIYLIDDPLLNTVRLFDGDVFKNQFKRKDLAFLWTRYDQLNTMDLIDTLVLYDKNKWLNTFDLEDYLRVNDDREIGITNDQYLTECIFMDDLDSMVFTNIPLLDYMDKLETLKEYTFHTSIYLTKEVIPLQTRVVFTWSKPTLTFKTNIGIKEYPLQTSLLYYKHSLRDLMHDSIFKISSIKTSLKDNTTQLSKEKNTRDEVKYITECIAEIKEVLKFKNNIKNTYNDNLSLSDNIIITRLDENGNIIEKENL